MKDKLIEIIIENTQKGRGTTIAMLSELLEKSRNFISRESNQFVEDGVLFCIQNKESQYFHKSTFEQSHQVEVTKKVFQSEAELKNHTQKEELKDFQKLIGYQDSLSDCVEQCIAAISYPNNSLPVLLNGPTGTGKSFIAQLMYEHAVNHNIIGENKPFVTVNCSEYANNPELLTANLFGHKKGSFTGADKDNVGFIQAANGGVLFLDEIHCLKAECQEKLFLFMDKGIYHKVGENEKWETSHVRLIFATTEKPEEALLKTFLRRVPITVIIPSLKDRGIYERIQLIHSIFAQEEQLIKRNIKISNFVYNLLIEYDFEGNIGDLKNNIKVCCANALREKADDTLEIHMRHLPKTLFKKELNLKIVQNESDDRLLSIAELSNEVKDNNRVIQLYNQLLKIPKQVNSEEVIFQTIKSYYDHILYDKKTIQDNKSDYLMNEISIIIKDGMKRYNYKINNNDYLLLLQYIRGVMSSPVRIRNWLMNHKDTVDEFHKLSLSLTNRESMVASVITEQINNHLDIAIDNMFASLLSLNLKMMNKGEPINSRIGIILAHGYSTASSIASATNKLLGQYVFDSIDMSIEVTTQEIIEELNEYLSKINHYQELVLLVDMGSLEEIYKGIETVINADIGIINNITTKLALEIGNELKQDTPLDALLKNACEQNSFQYHIIEKKEKEDILVCACASGMGTAEKIRQLLSSSLPAGIDLSILTYDYNQLLEKEHRNNLFERYNVKCVIGTLNPGIKNLLFIPIEELIMNQDLEILEDVFKQYLPSQEISEFRQRLLRNFSLTNIMNHLTILNPNKLLEHVATALDDFQQNYGIRIENNACVGLYVHICCMIERLVTHQPLDNYLDIKDLKTDHQDFITSIKQTFASVEKYYSVEIPEDEIGYIYDYISNNL